MTVPYAVTEFGMRDQVYGELRSSHEERRPDVDFTFATRSSRIGQLHGHRPRRDRCTPRDGLAEGHREGAAKDGLPIKWVAPSGMLVVQDYREMVGERFNSFISGKRVRMTLKIETTKIDKRRMAAGISPNFVHSLDASHMVSTVVECQREGLQSFAMVHDSFGTHAGNIDVLAAAAARCVRRAVRGRRARWIPPQQVVDQLPAELAEKVPPTPPFGKLEVSVCWPVSISLPRPVQPCTSHERNRYMKNGNQHSSRRVTLMNHLRHARVYLARGLVEAAHWHLDVFWKMHAQAPASTQRRWRCGK
jgi:hypothetical protein